MLFAILTVVFLIISCVLGVFVGVPMYSVTDGEVFKTLFYMILTLLIINIVIALIVRNHIPKKWLNPFAKIYTVHKWEQKFYIAIGVRVWKDRIPELGKTLANFDKRTIDNPNDNEYIYKFLQETLYAELMHSFSALLGTLIIFINLQLALLVALPLVILNQIINILPVIVQRYNRPKLIMLYRRNERKIEKNKI